jgi:hypothetical protein
MNDTKMDGESDENSLSKKECESGDGWIEGSDEWNGTEWNGMEWM